MICKAIQGPRLINKYTSNAAIKKCNQLTLAVSSVRGHAYPILCGRNVGDLHLYGSWATQKLGFSVCDRRVRCQAKGMFVVER